MVKVLLFRITVLCAPYESEVSVTFRSQRIRLCVNRSSRNFYANRLDTFQFLKISSLNGFAPKCEGFRPERVQDIWCNHVHDDFTFIAGDERYGCPGTLARLLSPKISSQQMVDPSFTEYVLETEDWNHQFPLFLTLAQGSRIRVPEESVEFFFSIAHLISGFQSFPRPTFQSFLPRL
jgi:hypothetical protein